MSADFDLETRLSGGLALLVEMLPLPRSHGSIKETLVPYTGPARKAMGSATVMPALLSRIL